MVQCYKHKFLKYFHFSIPHSLKHIKFWEEIHAFLISPPMPITPITYFHHHFNSNSLNKKKTFTLTLPLLGSGGEYYVFHSLQNSQMLFSGENIY